MREIEDSVEPGNLCWWFACKVVQHGLELRPGKVSCRNRESIARSALLIFQCFADTVGEVLIQIENPITDATEAGTPGEQLIICIFDEMPQV